jgi:hypothetical protein
LVTDARYRQFSSVVCGNYVRGKRVPIMQSDGLKPDLLEKRLAQQQSIEHFWL